MCFFKPWQKQIWQQDNSSFCLIHVSKVIVLLLQPDENSFCSTVNFLDGVILGQKQPLCHKYSPFTGLKKNLWSSAGQSIFWWNYGCLACNKNMDVKQKSSLGFTFSWMFPTIKEGCLLKPFQKPNTLCKPDNVTSAALEKTTNWSFIWFNHHHMVWTWNTWRSILKLRDELTEPFYAFYEYEVWEIWLKVLENFASGSWVWIIFSNYYFQGQESVF